MRPEVFKGCNRSYGEGQSDYLPLPARIQGPYGMVISRWRLSWRERLRVLLGAPVWISQYTFYSPLQPILPSIDKPEITSTSVPTTTDEVAK